MKTLSQQMEELITIMEQEITRLEEEWDKLDSQARVEDQNNLVAEMMVLRDAVDSLKKTISIIKKG